jgi:hypothetical protein
MAIPCPGSETVTSTQTATNTGISTKNTARDAANEARNDVLDDLKQKVDAAECQGGCIKVVGATNAPLPNARCRRLWWTLWIAVRCTATATGSVDVKCEIQG